MVDLSALGAPARNGVYFYRLVTSRGAITRSMTLLR
jgi:hypothetical protein